jgi:conjugative transfer pilus assembly protein TraH
MNLFNRIIKKIKMIIIIFWIFNCSICYANINSDLNSYFNDLGFSSNTTSPSAYHGQEAGFYTGGSILARNAIRDVQIVQIDLPSYRSGCGGIDLFAGGFSFINSDQLINMLNNILNNAAAYAFTLSLETVTPEIANVMKYWYDIANKVNQANLNSCETAEGIVGGLWPKTRSAQQRVCEDVGSSTNYFTDWAAARQGCGAGGDYASVVNSNKSNPLYKSMIIDTGNIAWKAIQQVGFLASDPELAELFMSLSGTVVLYKNGNSSDSNIEHVTFPALIQDDKILNSLLHGGEAKIYKCDTTDTDGCLHPSKSTVNITEDNAFSTHVAKILTDILLKIYDDTPLNDEEIGLLQSTSLPVYKMLNVQAASQKDKSIIDVTGYADIIAVDILFEYLRESLLIVKNSVATLPYPEEIIAELQPNLDKQLADLRKQQESSYKQLTMSIQLIEQTQTLEKMLSADLSSELSNTLSWAKGLQS